MKHFKIFLLNALLTVNVFAQGDWHEVTLPESHVVIKPCNEGKYVACKLMWKNKILIYDAVNFKDVFEIETRNEDYFFSASGSDLYLLYRDKNELFTYDLKSQTLVKNQIIEGKIVINEFVTAKKNTDYGIVFYRAYDARGGMAFVNLKNGQLIKVDRYSPYSENFQDWFSVDENLTVIASLKKSDSFKVDDPSKGKISQYESLSKTGDKSLDKYFRMSHDAKIINFQSSLFSYIDGSYIRKVKTPGRRYLSEDSHHYVVQYKDNISILTPVENGPVTRLKLPEEFKEVDNILYISAQERLIVQVGTRILINRQNANARTFKATPGKLFTLDFKLPPKHKVTTNTKLDNATIKDGIFTWAIPEDFAKGPQAITFSVLEPGSPKEKSQKIFIEIK